MTSSFLYDSIIVIKKNVFMKIYKIGGKIKGLRRSRSMTQKELGNILGYSESFMSYVEKGKRNISKDDLQKISKIFSVGIDFLLEGSREVNSKTSGSFVNFRHDKDLGEYSMTDDMLDDFKKYAKNQINE